MNKKVGDLRVGQLVKTGDVWREVESVMKEDANGSSYWLTIKGFSAVRFPSTMTFEVAGGADPFSGLLDGLGRRPL